MPKRVGNLWQKVIDKQNCINAEKEMAKNKPDNKMARHIGEHAERYGSELSDKLTNGTFVFHQSRVTYIKDSYKGKTRRLQIPCLEDQSAMQAWLLVASPYIERRNYFYNCGSIPKAGQSRAVEGVKKRLRGKKPPKWAAVTDIKKFYETCPHWVVMRGLRRIFKDKQFLEFAERILASMSDTGVGLAIGYPVSHWFANVALMEIDHELTRLFPDVKFARYMDDIAMTSRNKRHLRKALLHLKQRLHDFGMELKRKTEQIFPIKARGITFLSYRFYQGYTIIAKGLMYRISRKMRRAAKNMSLHMAMGVISYLGILKHCDSYNFRIKHVYPYIKPKKCRRMISNASKSNLRPAA